MKIVPIENCPVCQIPVKWILYDGMNSYDCANSFCPIKFTERVQFPVGTKDFNFKNENGNLIYYSFTIDTIPVIVNSNSIFIYPKYQFGNPIGGSIVINERTEFNWSNLLNLKKKIKLWITLS